LSVLLIKDLWEGVETDARRKNWLKSDLNKQGEIFCDSADDSEKSLSQTV